MGFDFDNILSDTEDWALEPEEIDRRKKLLDGAFAGDIKAIRTLYTLYGLTYLRRGEKEVNILEVLFHEKNS